LGLARERFEFVASTGPEGSVNTNFFAYHFDVGVRVFATRYLGVSGEFRSVEWPAGNNVSFYRVLIGAVLRVD
jgi:hypothetical protein